MGRRRSDDPGANSERMAIELTIYLDVPADIDQQEMDRVAATICRGVVDDLGADAAVVSETPAYLVDRERKKT